MDRSSVRRINAGGIKLVATDIDGVWTDGSIMYSSQGEAMKRFSTYDGMGVQLLHEASIPVAVFTGEDSVAVAARCRKLGIDHYFPGEKDKLLRAKELCGKINIELDEIAYIGDDVNDLDLLKNCGISCMPGTSPILHMFSPDYTTERPGGNGAFREFGDIILNNR